MVTECLNKSISIGTLVEAGGQWRKQSLANDNSIPIWKTPKMGTMVFTFIKFDECGVIIKIEDINMVQVQFAKAIGWTYVEALDVIQK